MLRTKSIIVVFFRSQYEIQIESRINGIIHIRTGWHDQLFFRQHLCQCIPIRIPFQTQFHHRVADHLRCPFTITQHNTFVQNDSVQFHVVRLVRHTNDIKVGRRIVLGGCGVLDQLWIDQWILTSG